MRSPLRTVAFGVGLVAAVAVLAGRAALAPVARRAVLAAEQDAPEPEPAIPPGPTGPAGRTTRAVRRLLAAAGVAVLLVGVWKLLGAVQPASYVWLAVWLLGAVLLNDAVIAPTVGLLRALAHRVLRRLPPTAVAVVDGGFVTAGVLVLVVVPAIWAKHLGTANPTILPGDYAGRLLMTLAVIGLLTVLGAGVLTYARRHAATER